MTLIADIRAAAALRSDSSAALARQNMTWKRDRRHEGADFLRRDNADSDRIDSSYEP
jgi:hypothetical protein